MSGPPRGGLARESRAREAARGRTYYNFNLRLEATNVCVASCLFCSFARLKPGDPDAYTMSLEQVFDKLRQRAAPAAHRSARRQRPASGSAVRYYLDLLRGLKAIRPGIHLKCFTAVEIAFFADTLRHDRRAGAARVDGRRARLAARRRRGDLSPSACAGRSAHDKADADRYLAIHRLAHRLGMRSNVTMLYGHIETIEERVDHMLRARALQDETGGFQAFIPLAFHPDNNQMRKLPAPSAIDTLRVHAVARLMLDNIPHIKAFWIATGVEVAQMALWYGADDLDGTVQEERIYHMAGSRTPEIADDGRHPAADPRRRPRAGRAGHALQRHRAAAAAVAPTGSSTPEPRGLIH